MKKIIILLVANVMAINFAFTQGAAINTTGASADPSAMLDVSGTTSGVLINRMTETQRNAIVSPAFGLQIFNTTTGCFNFWTGNTWKQICGDCDFNSPIADNNGPICQGSTLNLTATSIIGATYQWSGPNGFTSTDQNPSISSATAAASGSYSVTASKNGCTSTPQSTVATVNTTPVTPTAGNSGPVCVGTVLNLTTSTIVGAIYSWTGPNGYSAIVQNPIITSVALTHAGTYNVTATVNGCISAAGTTTVTINAIPVTPDAITGSTSPCANSTGNVYSITTVPGATSYNWTIPTGATITTNSGTSITVTFGSSSGNITVSATNICGTSLLSISNITINTIPATPGTITGTASACSNSTGNVYTIAAVSGATSYNWTIPSGATITANNGTSITVTFGSNSGNIAVTSTNICGNSAQSTLAITILVGGSGSQTFNYSGSQQTFTVPACVTSIIIETWGAQGGNGSSAHGGYGANIKGTFNLTPGEVLKILVGEQGHSEGGTCDGGGGGGTFVTRNDNTPLCIAGGGGGFTRTYNGYDASITNNGVNGLTQPSETSYPAGAGGTSGNGGGGGYFSAGGGGLLTDGGNGTGGTTLSTGGKSFVNGGAGGVGQNGGTGAQGGFGGGGGGLNNCWGGGGGGGGYSGGGAGGHYGSGGGGGSYNGGTNQTNTAGVRSGNGKVVLTW